MSYVQADHFYSRNNAGESLGHSIQAVNQPCWAYELDEAQQELLGKVPLSHHLCYNLANGNLRAQIHAEQNPASSRKAKKWVTFLF